MNNFTHEDKKFIEDLLTLMDYSNYNADLPKEEWWADYREAYNGLAEKYNNNKFYNDVILLWLMELKERNKVE